jgi:hypothetical protein
MKEPLITHGDLTMGVPCASSCILHIYKCKCCIYKKGRRFFLIKAREIKIFLMMGKKKEREKVLKIE